jgi:hypothetical protein
VAAEEGRARMADTREQGARLPHHHLQVLGRQPVGQRRALLPVAHEDDGAMPAPAFAAMAAAGSEASACSTARATASASRRRR